MAADPTLAKLQEQQKEADLRRQQATTDYNASRATATENLAAMKKQAPIDVEAQKQAYAAGGVYSHQMNQAVGILQSQQALQQTQAQRGINTAATDFSISGQINKAQQGLLTQAIQARKIADQLGVADLSQGELATAFKLGVIGQAQYEQALGALGYGKKEADLLAAIAEKQLALASGQGSGGGLDLPGSVYSAEGAPTDQVALAKQFGKQYNVDPNLLLAIAYHETQFGKLGAGRQGYILGYGIGQSQYAGTVAQYANAARTIRQRLGGSGPIGINQVAAIQPWWAPVGASNDPTGLNRSWVSGVQAAYNLIVSGQLKAPGGGSKGFQFPGGDSYSFYNAGKWADISAHRGSTISDKNKFRTSTVYGDYLSAAKKYLSQNGSSANAHDLIHYIYLTYVANKVANPSGKIFSNAHILSLVLYDLESGNY